MQTWVLVLVHMLGHVSEIKCYCISTSYKTSGCGNKKGIIYGNLSKANISCCPIQHSTNPCFTSTYKTDRIVKNVYKIYGNNLVVV